jgi:hypothetical protein
MWGRKYSSIFLDLATRGERLDSCPCRFTQEQKRIRGRTGWAPESVWKPRRRKPTWPCQESNPGSPDRPYMDCAIPAVQYVTGPHNFYLYRICLRRTANTSEGGIITYKKHTLLMSPQDSVCSFFLFCVSADRNWFVRDLEGNGVLSQQARICVDIPRQIQFLPFTNTSGRQPQGTPGNG